MAKTAKAMRKRSASSSRSGGARGIESAIRKAQTRVAKEGKTDEIENLLDELEHQINDLKDTGIAKSTIKGLKSQLDLVK